MTKKLHVTHLADSEELRNRWKWFLMLGLVLLFLGIVAISCSQAITLFSVFLLGCFFLVGGGIQVTQTFMTRSWHGHVIPLLLSILYIVAGLICVFAPKTAAIDLTLFIGFLALVGGLFKMITPFFMRFQTWGWVTFNGLVTFLLGLLILAGWPSSGLWLIGTFIGIDMLLAGWCWVVLALQTRNSLQS